MRECRHCGAALPRKEISAKAREIAIRNIDHFTKLLAEEGQFLPVDQERSVRRIMYESELALNGEYTFEEAVCSSCRGR